MRRVYALTLGLLLLTVRAERNFQGYHTEQTNGTTVTKDLLLKKENTIGHGTEAPPRENTYRHAAVAVTAKIPEVVSDTRPPPRLERIQMTKAMTVIASSHKERFAFRNRQKLTSQKGNSTATRIYTESDMPLISNYEKIVLPSTQAAFESMMNNTSEPEVNLSTDAVKSSLWLHTLHVNRSQRSSESIPLTSADRGLGLPVLSASHPHVIDNLAALLHDNADKQAQGKNEKEISTLKRNKSPSGTMQSIIQKPGLSPTVSSNSLSEAPALDFQSSHANPVETSATQGPASTNPALHRSSKLLFPVRNQLKNMEREKFEKKESTVPPHLKTHPSLSTNFKNTFILHQPLDVSSGSENNTPVITEAALSTQKSVFQEGGDHNAASHPTARIRLIEAHRTVVPFSFGKRTTSAVKNPESHSLTGRAASLISALRSQTPAKPSSQTKELTLTPLPKDSAIKFTSTTAKTQASPTFPTLNSIVQQSSVYPSGPANKPVMKEPQFPTFTTQKTDVPVTLLSESRQESDDVVSMLTLTPVLSKSSSGRLAMHRFSGTQSKISSEKTLDVTTPPSFARRNTDLRGESHVVHNLKLGDKSEQVWTAAAEDQDIINTEDRQGEEITDTTERQKSQNDKEELFNLDKVEKGSGEELIVNGVEVNQKTDRERQNMEEHESNTSRENTGGIKEEDAKEDADRKDTTIINTGNITKDAAANPRECLTKEGAETRREGTARKKDLIHNREIGREDVTNVPPGATTDSEELNRDKGHTVINSSPCRSLIKRLEATEQKGIYLAENTARNVEMKNTAFSYKVTSNHRQLHSTLRSRMMSPPTEPYTQIKPRPSLHGAMITKPGDASSLATASAQNKVSEDTFSVTAIQKMVPKHTSGVRASKLSDARKPTVSPRSSSTKSAHPAPSSISDVTSLTTPRLAITAGFLKAQPHVTVNSSTLSLSIIYSISNHSHTLLTSGSKSDSLIQTMTEPGQILESRVKDSLTSNLIHDVNMSTSVIPAAPQQMYSDSSSRPLTAGTLSSEAHISIGRLQPHQGQSAGQISQSSSSSSFDMTSGQKCSFQLSAHAAHSHALHPPVDDNRQRSLQTLMATMSPKARNDQLSPSSMSILLNSMLLRADSLPGTYSSTAITRSGSEEETSEDEYANTGSGRAETLLGPSEETNQTEKNGRGLTIVSSAVKHSDAAMPSTHEMFSTAFIAQSVGGSRRNADNVDDFSSASMSHAEKRAVENVNENDHNNRFNIDRNNAANKAVKLTLNNNHPSQLEGYNETSTQPIMFAIQTTHKTEQAIREHFLPVTDDSASFRLEPNDGAETEPDYLVPEMPQTNANYVMTDAYFNVGSPAAETSGRHMFPGSVSDNAVAVPQINPQSDLKVSNTSTQQTAVQTLDATSEFQIITTRNNDFVSPAARINGPVSRESHELELTTSGRTQVFTEKSFQVAHAGLWSLREPPPGKDAPAANGENAAETQSVDAATHPVTAHRFTGGPAPNAKPPNGKYVGPGQGAPPAPGASEYDRATTDELTRNDAKKTTTKTQRAFVDMGHVQRRTAKKTAQPDVTATHTAINSIEWPLVPETNAKTQLMAGAAEGDSAQSAMRSVDAAAEGVMPGQEPGRRLLLLEPGSDPALPAWKHRRTPPHLYLSGVTEVSEDLCGSGNYTAEMSLNLGRDVEPGDAVPVLGNLRVVINLKTNNSLINLEVTSCCLSPTVLPDLTNSTCCLFSRLAAEPVGITLLPSALSTSASFTISLFQMINYSVVYLHCDLSVCPRNRSDCERECPEQRRTFPADGPDAVVANLRNRISFGPMLKEVKNSTFLEEIEPSELDLALVIVSLVVGSSLVTVMLLLVWLAYRRRAVWLLHSAAPAPACCGCMRPGGDLILP